MLVAKALQGYFAIQLAPYPALSTYNITPSLWH